MNPSVPRIKIHVLAPDAHDDDVPLTDVGVVNVDGERHLFLSPQSFYSAVRQVSAAMPDLPLEQVERLVRDHCEFKDFDELLGSTEPAPPVDLPPHTEEPPAPVGPSGRAKKWVIAAALLPALAGSWALGHFTGVNSASTAASAPDRSTARNEAAKDNRNLGPEPFTAPDFKDFSVAGKISCSPIDDLEAECTDSDGMVMATKAATGPDSTIFTFSYGKERLGLRIFGTAEYAKTWAMQDASRELYPNMVLSGRYVLWGTDEERLKDYEGELLAAAKTSAGAAHQATAMGHAEPLPPRLAALTLGTLGLDEHEVRTILYAPQDATVDAPVLLAARAVLGVPDASPDVVKPGEEDIVALAAGLEPPPATGPDTRTATARPDDPASGTNLTGGSSGESTETAPATAPAPSPDREPVDSEQTQKPEEPEPKPEPTPEPEPTPQSKDEPTPEPEPTPVEPEDPSPAPVEPAPVDPAPPVTETPAPPSEPDAAQTQPPAGGAAQEPPASGGQASPDGEDGELLALPQAWIAPAA
ncbi:hypothetical protein [Streptomyces griseocarneus]|uniref:hypothetical protein n=1 Tax=Streptomyces griseocarneus TaxID=51201 RepID=UPI00167E7FEE|nr:hypothetical protein [Streptomyces griseocarneus]MBZ6476637.1 hypothetical protein [Streptomyces griseocarneus]GHG80082.1 hypothetical protein GCM10018779_61290 [Streptomyces griseocarneus]